MRRHTLRCAVYIFLISNGKILFLLRHKTGWRDGYYGLPSGHLNVNETTVDAIIRETNEEIGIKVNPENLRFVHVMHRKERGNYEYIDLFFILKKWQGTPINNESKKASYIKWFNLNSLPQNIVPNVKAAINYYKDNNFFSEFS